MRPYSPFHGGAQLGIIDLALPQEKPTRDTWILLGPPRSASPDLNVLPPTASRKQAHKNTLPSVSHMNLQGDGRFSHPQNHRRGHKTAGARVPPDDLL